MSLKGPHRRIVLVRHGETAWNAEGRWQGQREVALSERGREQARALGRRFAGATFEAAYCSGLGRTRETAELALQGRLVPTPVAELAEIGYGEWEGVVDTEVHARWPELRRLWTDSPHEVQMVGGESLADVQRRAVPAFERILDAHSGDLLVVAHGGTNRVILAHVLRMPLSSFWRLQQVPSAVNVLEVPVGARAPDALLSARIGLLNCTGHL